MEKVVDVTLSVLMFLRQRNQVTSRDSHCYLSTIYLLIIRQSREEEGGHGTGRLEPTRFNTSNVKRT